MFLRSLLPLCALLSWSVNSMRADHLSQLRLDTVDTFYHGYRNYMHHAFPEDELRPLTCSSLTRDRSNPDRIDLNDALGNYSLTLIDSLSTLAILAGGPQDGSYTGPQALSDFQDGIANFVHHYGDGRPGPSGTGIRATGFDLDSKVQVFETVIRGLGGLLSAHLFAIGELPITGYDPKPMSESPASDDPLELAPIPWPNGFKYDGQLLRLALDLGQRLLPAFYTTTGIPYPRVNLRAGIPFYVNSPLNQPSGEATESDGRTEITETCSAGAGSLTLEFTVLSRLTGDPRFEQVAKRAFWEVWSRRSEIGLIGNGLDAEGGQWIGPHSGIGAGMDSFFEYALKSHILLSGHSMPNESTTQRKSTTDWLDPNSLHGPLPAEMHSSDAFLEAWHQAHASVKRHIYNDRNHYPYYSNNHRATGQPYTTWIDSLGAFYPGLLALAGEVEEAIEANLVYTALWTRYAAIPERWSIRENNVVAGIGWWPGRPEFIESTYHIYRATRDPWYLHVGEMVLKDIRRRCYAPCGWAGLQDVQTGEKQDRMESFFLGETTKYMYLLFDPDHPLNNLDAAYVFTTEGHPLILPKETRSERGSRTHDGGKGKSVYKYYDDSFTNSCPAPILADSLSMSATAARRQLFDVSRFTNLHNTPNIHGPVEMVQVEDTTTDGPVTKYRALSNYTIFPWTLPPSLLPLNGTCAAPSERVISRLEFPAADVASSLLSTLGASLTWYSYVGPTVRKLEGLRLQLEREHSEAHGDDVWKITHLGNVQLGRHETVFFYAEHVKDLKDEAFTCRRRADAVEIELLVDFPTEKSETMPVSADTGAASSGSPSGPPSGPPSDGAGLDESNKDDLATSAQTSLLKHLLRAVSSVFEPTHTDFPSADGSPGAAPILSFFGHTAGGPGAFPVHSMDDTPIQGSPYYDAENPTSNFPWSSIFLADYACDGPLPDAASRDHQLIVMRRGRCSFSDKLSKVPIFFPSTNSLQLVIIVDETDEGSRLEGGTERPFLVEEQLTPNGNKRLHGVPMVLISGERGDYERFGKASAAGMRRKYRVESEGLLIENAVVV
ncbi:Glycosyl hydrolase family 47 [Drechmeria coniospora]|uniref:alpha-1,2-Mannosidase n=1 Tax=Drechmeria coniospora TaxID=98403 RepID=A0A151GI63_DRECN|nr:Glycosyl hydrolase family 47 [Drechmeria coniospora]KYK56759.1 Glycosyl hydrolase family 47 [Drechmeria coniospora]